MKYMSTYNGSLPMMLYRSLETVMPIYREVFSQYNLTEQQWRILRVLWRKKRVTSNELSQQTLLAPNSLGGIIDRLEKRGLVARERSTTDRRIIYVLPTEQGRALETQVIPQVDAIHATIRTTVSEQEWQALESTLNKISAKLNAVTTGGTQDNDSHTQ